VLALRDVCMVCSDPSIEQRSDSPLSDSYGLECHFPALNTGPPSSGPAGSKRPASTDASPSEAPQPPIRSLEPVPESGIQTTLMDISARLHSIEASLTKVHLHFSADSHSDSSSDLYPSLNRHQPSERILVGSSKKHAEAFGLGAEVNANPLQTVSDTLVYMEAMVKETTSALAANQNGSAEPSEVFSGLGYKSPPDAIVIGLMSLSECEACFDL
jgi:hypothetical protein